MASLLLAACDGSGASRGSAQPVTSAAELGFERTYNQFRSIKGECDDLYEKAQTSVQGSDPGGNYESLDVARDACESAGDSLTNIRFETPIGRRAAADLNEALDACSLAAWARGATVRLEGRTIGAKISPKEMSDAKAQATQAAVLNTRCGRIMRRAILASGLGSQSNLSMSWVDDLDAATLDQLSSAPATPGSDSFADPQR